VAINKIDHNFSVKENNEYTYASKQWRTHKMRDQGLPLACVFAAACGGDCLKKPSATFLDTSDTDTRIIGD